MNLWLETLLLTATALCTVLLVGTFLAFSLSINAALKSMDSKTHIHVMQVINRKVQNPLFLCIFMLPVVLLPLSTFMLSERDSTAFLLMLGSSVLYIFGTFGITVAGNVPLNDHLDAVGSDDEKMVDRQRQEYARKWNRLHDIRTALGVVAATLLVCAIVIR